MSSCYSLFSSGSRSLDIVFEELLSLVVQPFRALHLVFAAQTLQVMFSAIATATTLSIYYSISAHVFFFFAPLLTGTDMSLRAAFLSVRSIRFNFRINVSCMR